MLCCEFVSAPGYIHRLRWNSRHLRLKAAEKVGAHASPSWCVMTVGPTGLPPIGFGIAGHPGATRGGVRCTIANKGAEQVSCLQQCIRVSVIAIPLPAVRE